MCPTIRWVLAFGVPLLAAGGAWGQAGRYIPIPPVSGGGSGVHFVPHIPGLGGVNADVFWVFVAVIGVIVLAVIGWHLGQRLGRGARGPTFGPRHAGQTAWANVSAPAPDLILNPAEVAEKARRTFRLLDMLSRKESLFEPSALAAFIDSTFRQVQQCWEARDYGPVEALLMPVILYQHQGLLRAMRRNREINRIDGLEIGRLEFVHVSCPEETEQQEVTALITFAAKVYFVDERTGAYLRGDRLGRLYQEFWTFRRQGEGWRLQAIARSHESDRLKAENRVAGMTATELRNVQEGVIML
jgi:predicted lipid-binding transport protein (Tim44 family)